MYKFNLYGWSKVNIVKLAIVKLATVELATAVKPIQSEMVRIF